MLDTGGHMATILGLIFTQDGKQIVWRRFDEQGLIADVWTMKPDGSEQRQITDFGSMSWAPYEHPSGEYEHRRRPQPPHDG